MKQRVWSKAGLVTLKMVTVFKGMLAEMLTKHNDSELYILKYHSIDDMVKEIKIFETLSVLDSNPHKHFSVYIKYDYRNIWKSRQTQMIETVNVVNWI